MTRDQFESRVAELTKPFNGQLPRPWMTTLTNPLDAQVFIVGRNQKNGYSASRLPHKRHVDALFNRYGESCRGVYDELTDGRASPTRANTDRLVAALAKHGVKSILETNVICYSTPMSADLAQDEHRGGRAKGNAIFAFLLDAIGPRILIAHGDGTRSDLAITLGRALEPPSEQNDRIARVQVGDRIVYCIPSLAPPAWNGWCRHANQVFDDLALSIREDLQQPA